MRCMIGTPLLLNGMWSSSIPAGRKSGLKMSFPVMMFLWCSPLSVLTRLSYQSAVEVSSLEKVMFLAPTRCRSRNMEILTK